MTKRKALDFEEKLKIISQLDQGLKQVDAAKKYAISQSTIATFLKKRKDIEDAMEKRKLDCKRNRFSESPRIPNQDLLSAVQLKSNNLRRSSTKITYVDGQQYVETLLDNGSYFLEKSGLSHGFVVDPKADITVSVIMDGLILGSQDVAVELKILEDFNVTHILNVGYKIPNYYESKFVYKNVEILDDPTKDIRIFFDGCFDFIDDGRKEGCILVHCNAGVSRAPTIVIAYLMNRCEMTLKDAFELVKSVRPIVRPNDGFMKALKDYEAELFEGKKNISNQ